MENFVVETSLNPIVEITDVRKDSAADKADVKNGDELLSINGLPASEADLNTINGYFNTKPGKKIKLELLRNGKKLKKMITLVSQI